MSKRNSQEAKRAARERLRIERERQAKKDKARRQLTVAAVVVGVLAAAGGVGYAVVQSMQPDYWDKAKDKKLVKPAGATGEDGTTVVIGDKDAKKTLELYEDARCPACAAFEQAAGEQLHKDVKDGKYKVQFIGATFIDNAAPGEGSRNALSALGAALNVSPDAFLDYKTALYSEKNHPSESDDKFKDDAYLIKVANEVPDLKDNDAFQKDVKDGTFDKWALNMSDKFSKSGVQGTPTLKMDGEKLETPQSLDEFKTTLDAALKK
ncbi:DsbA family protein [Streptomyces sp. O3]